MIDGEEVAVLEPSGQFTVVSLATGKLRFSVPLVAEPSLGWMQIIRSDGQYLLLASQESNSPSGGLTPLQLANSSQRVMHGRVYAFNRTNGKLQWQSPAFVSHHCLPPDQPTESPLLLFVAVRQGGNKTATAILALDRRTGRKVYDEELGTGMTVTCEIAADPAKQAMSLALIGQSNRSFTFQFTDKPQPPQPPAQTGDMASSSAGRPAGTVDNSLGAAIELLRRGVNPAVLGPPAQPAAPAR